MFELHVEIGSGVIIGLSHHVTLSKQYISMTRYSL